MHIKVKQYERASAMKSKSSSHPYHQLYLLSPEATAITKLLRILLENFMHAQTQFFRICVFV